MGMRVSLLKSASGTDSGDKVPAALGIAAFALPAGDIGVATPEYVAAPFSQGFINGYLTMDTLGALVFGIVIVNAIRSRGVESPALITRYAIIAGLIAGVGIKLLASIQSHPLGRPLCLALAGLTFAAMAWLRLPLFWILAVLGGAACVLTFRKLAPS